jgi:hypothetical protein
MYGLEDLERHREWRYKRVSSPPARRIQGMPDGFYTLRSLGMTRFSVGFVTFRVEKYEIRLFHLS